eukprot:TRINITY_DN13486_c0_g1_i1.p1 TRINITY_DN13486_c0_g1~~TRINITY_DN13486_c0_g1_i1.p1  ORF type:complete len:281 (+),score=55.92 TRINITY_DN13486_c0_g1_i1:129-845(+)
MGRPAGQHGVTPLVSFCCGCELETGVKAILCAHAVSSAFYIFTTFVNVVLDRPSIGYHVSLATQSFNCGFALASLPFIASGISGVRHKIEIHLRIYFVWLALTLGLNVLFVAFAIAKSSCIWILVSGSGAGGSFECGAVRAFAIFFTLTLLGFVCYLAFAVWSYCEELKYSGSEFGFDLLAQRDPRGVGPAVGVGLFGTGATDGPYGSLSHLGMPGSVPIFGEAHDCNYPPRPPMPRG